VIRPTPTTSGRAFIWYWAYPTSMSTDSSEHGLPYGARDVLINYALYRSWIMKDPDRAASFKTLYKESLDDYIEFVAQSRQQITKDSVEVKFGTDLYDYD
jgi:hypothetical protein